MRNEWRHIDEVALCSLSHKLQPIAPPQPGYAIHYIDDAFEVAVMVSTGLGLGINGDGAGPKLGRAGALRRYCSAPLHPECLCRAGIQLVATNDADTVRPPSTRTLSHMRSRRALIQTNAISVTIPAPDK